MNTYKSFLKIKFSIQMFFFIFSSTLMASSINLSANQIKNNLPELGSSQSDTENNSSDKLIATGLTRSAQIILSDNSDEMTKNLFQSTVYGYLSKEMNNWLNQYGNARIQLNTDKRFNAEVLLPVYDKENSLIFSQSRLQRQHEDRTILNLGLGYRYFMTNMMLGVNSFYDRDLTHNNARLGLGSEFSADYIKLSTNGYFRLTDWRQSKLSNFTDYDERPANGFDIYAEGFLPSYPYLGASVKYEKYFGDNVNLKGSSSISDLKNDPEAYTVGISYTPVPLISFKISQLMGDVNETKGLLSLNYRFGVPLNQQLDSSFVPQMRTLQGGRYDFVERNNNIVMQYKKHDEIIIIDTSKLPDATVGTNYSEILLANGGEAPYTWDIAPNDLPDGLVLNGNVIQGIPSIAGDFTLNIKVTDNKGVNTTKILTLHVNFKEIESKLFGVNISESNSKNKVVDDSENTWNLEAPNYYIYGYGGTVVDSIGPNESEKTGGGNEQAGNKAVAIPTTNLKKIEVNWGRYTKIDAIRITEIKFIYNDGTSKTIGGTNNQYITADKGSGYFDVTPGYQVEKVKVIAGGIEGNPDKYVSQIQFFEIGPYK